MFAPPVAKPKTAASSDGKSTLQHSTLFGQRLGDAEQAHIVRPLPKGGASLNAGQDAVPASMRAKDEPPGPAWDFSNIPVLSPGREKPFQMPPLFPAPRLPGPLQAKLKVGAVDDPLEHEADRGAEQVMRMPAPDAPITSTPPQISRKCAACEEEEEKLQKKPAGPQAATSEAPGIVHEVLRLSGQPLDEATRTYFEPRFGYDFSRVRVHRDADAGEISQQLSALAFTHGIHIYFGNDMYDPAKSSGKCLSDQSSGHGHAGFRSKAH